MKTSYLDESPYACIRAFILNTWFAEYSKLVDDTEAQNKKSFGVELEKKLAERGHKLGGQYPDLQSGIFTLELNFDAGKTKLWYGPKQELLDQFTLSVEDIVRGIEKARHGLGSGLGREEFLAKITQAFYRVIDKKMGDTAPIINVLSEVALLLQSQKFQSDPRREHYKTYSRADFSFDLYQIRHSDSQFKTEITPQLVVATRTHTSNRQNFIWIPDDETGRGTTYSHIKIKGG